jgi:tRNA U34 5-carboxymethylaminomethyl modifying GTPase MnmE/TrmE
MENPQEEPKFVSGQPFLEKADKIITIHRPEQETLEEAAERLYPLLELTNHSSDLFVVEENLQLLGHRKSFIDGAKWQQEQDVNMVQSYLSANLQNIELLEKSYSEEEVLKLLINFSDDRTFLKKDVAIQWFEQVKKKT